VAASRHVQDLDPVVIPRAQPASAHVPTVVDLDALRLAPFPVARPRAAVRVVPASPALDEALPEREPTFDELLHGLGVDGTDGGAPRPGRARWSRRRRAARAKDPRGKEPRGKAAHGRGPRVRAPRVEAPRVEAPRSRASTVPSRARGTGR
jgi:hypothetical protein